jgi:hypothetical protein
MPMSTQWTDEFLDEMRELGDPPADAVVAEIFADAEVGAVNALMKTLVRNDGLPAAKLPRVVRDYLDATDDLPPWADPERIERGGAFFELHGPACVMALACASLPACYAARRGVQVLAMTDRLESNPTRRIGETAQLTIHTMAPGGLAKRGQGIRDAQKVRLMHAAVRHLVAASPHWEPDWGTPVNQEDLAGTLMTFSVVVLDALSKLDTTFSDEDADAYFHAWNCVGHVMGVDGRLMTDTIDDGRALWRRIIERNWDSCPEGRAMTAALIGAMEHATPGTLFDGFASTCVRHLGGDELADILGVRKHDWTTVLRGPLRMFAHDTDAADDLSPLIARTAAQFSKQLLEGFSWVARGGERAPFDIPLELAKRWQIRSAADVLS